MANLLCRNPRVGIQASNSATYGGGIYNIGTLVNTKNVFFDNTVGDIYSS